MSSAGTLLSQPALRMLWLFSGTISISSMGESSLWAHLCFHTISTPSLSQLAEFIDKPVNYERPWTAESCHRGQSTVHGACRWGGGIWYQWANEFRDKQIPFLIRNEKWEMLTGRVITLLYVILSGMHFINFPHLKYIAGWDQTVILITVGNYS